MRMMQQLEDDATKEDRSFLRLREAAAIDDYRWVFENVFQKWGGWERAKYTARATQFSDTLKETRQKASRIGQMLSLPMSVPRINERASAIVGISRAAICVPELQEYKTKVGRSSLLKYWEHFKYVAPWMYIVYGNHGPNFRTIRPPLPNNPKFVNILFERIKDAEGLTKFFGTYGFVASRLAEHGYHSPKFHCSSELPDAALEIPPLSEYARMIIKEWEGH